MQKPWKHSDSAQLQPRTKITATGLQMMMDYWERLHPVNAVHFVELSRPVTPKLLQASVNRLFDKFLASGKDTVWPTLSRNRPHPSDSRRAISVQSEQLHSDTTHSLEALVTRLLNEPFSDNEPPFRIGLAEQSGTCHVWLAYRHCIADGRSVALLMQNLLEDLNKGQHDALPLNLDRTNRTLKQLFPDEAKQADWLGSLRTSIGALWTMQRCHRGGMAIPNDFSTTFQIHAERIPIEPIRRRAAECGGTVGELIIAAMLEWFLIQDRQQPRRRWAPYRSVSVIVDLARRSGAQNITLFGQFISFLNIRADAHRVRNFSELVNLVHRQTRARNVPIENLRRLRSLEINSYAVRRVPRAIAIGTQDALFPVSGTISYFNLSAALPPPRTALASASYFRGTCATQLSPIIICPTRGNDLLSLTSTHFNAMFSEAEVRDLGQHIMSRCSGDSPCD